MASILLVDDAMPTRKTTARLLRDGGHRVREADGVRSAIDALGGEPFDVVLTDLRMPDGDGLDVLREARARRPDAVVILLTSYAEWQSAKDAMRLGAIDYLEKGFDADDLLRRVDDAVASSQHGGSRTEKPASAGAGPGQRAIVTVLFADIRGSMELMASQDLESARAVLDAVVGRLITSVHHHGGTVSQVLGDGIMALFGAPRPADDHALRACAASAAMQEAVAQYASALHRTQGLDVQIRVGLASGEVILRSVDSDFHRHFNAVGFTTHLAARLEHAARPGTVLMSAATRQQAGPAVRAVSRERMALKGLPDGVETYELVGFEQGTDADGVATARVVDPGR
jgi:class 3 adenylate cyclase